MYDDIKAALTAIKNEFQQSLATTDQNEKLIAEYELRISKLKESNYPSKLAQIKNELEPLIADGDVEQIEPLLEELEEGVSGLVSKITDLTESLDETKIIGDELEQAISDVTLEMKSAAYNSSQTFYEIFQSPLLRKKILEMNLDPPTVEAIQGLKSVDNWDAPDLTEEVEDILSEIDRIIGSKA